MRAANRKWYYAHLDAARAAARVRAAAKRGGLTEWYGALGIEWKNPEEVRAYKARRVLFIDRRVFVSSNPRTGVCSQCGRSVHKGEIRKTGMHHDAYVVGHPLAETRELCSSCHRKHHQRRGTAPVVSNV